MGHPLKRIVSDLGIPPARLNVSSFDLPLLPNRVLRAAAAFRTPTDQQVHKVETPMVWGSRCRGKGCFLVACCARPLLGN